MEEDPVFYKRFGQLIDDAIRNFIDKRITEAQYLHQMLTARKDLAEGRLDDTPGELNGKPEARAIFGIIKQVLLSDNLPSSNEQANQLARAGIELADIIKRLTIRDWKRNDDVQKQMKNELEDYLLLRRKDLGVEITYAQLDIILEEVLKVARNVF